jgi:hypothetical protein
MKRIQLDFKKKKNMGVKIIHLREMGPKYK